MIYSSFKIANSLFVFSLYLINFAVVILYGNVDRVSVYWLSLLTSILYCIFLRVGEEKVKCVFRGNLFSSQSHKFGDSHNFFDVDS